MLVAIGAIKSVWYVILICVLAYMSRLTLRERLSHGWGKTEVRQMCIDYILFYFSKLGSRISGHEVHEMNWEAYNLRRISQIEHSRQNSINAAR